MLETGKKVLYGFWLIIVLGVIIAYFVKPEWFTAEYLSQYFQSSPSEVFYLYVIITFVRGFFMIPSTPFVILGALLFPDQLLLVWIISMSGVLFSALLLYYFSDLLGFSTFLEKKYPNQIVKWKSRLSKPQATLYVFAWACFPFVPTDLVCYLGGIIKMPVVYVIGGVFLGEGLLNLFYVYFGNEVVQLF